MDQDSEQRDLAPAPSGDNSDRGVVSKRGRRLLIAVVIILILALVGISVLLASLVIPRASSIAKGDEAGGIEWVKSIYGWGPAPSEQLAKPQKLFIDDTGVIWVSDSRYKFVMAFSPEGDLLDTVGGDTKEPILGIGPVAIGPEGSVLAGEPLMDRILVFGADGANLGSIPVPDPTDLDYLDDTIVVGSRGGFAFLDAQTGKPRQVIGTQGKGKDQFDTVGGITFGSDGRVYLVDTFNNRLKAYEANGELIWSVDTGAAGNRVEVTGAPEMQESRATTAPANLQVPADICMDGNGRLVVVDGLDFSVSVFDAKNGDFIVKYGTYGQKDGQLVFPSSIDYDPQRDWFAIADTGNSRVQIVRIPGSGATLDPLGSARRLLAGPLRACLAPLLLMLLVFIVYVVMRKRRQQKVADSSHEVSDSTGDQVVGS